MKKVLGLVMLLCSIAFVGTGKTIVETFDPGSNPETPRENVIPLYDPNRPAISVKTGYCWRGCNVGWGFNIMNSLGCGISLDFSGIGKGYGGFKAWTEFNSDVVSPLKMHFQVGRQQQFYSRYAC